MKKNIPAMTCIFLTAWYSAGQTVDISGKVVDESAAAVAGAAVTLLNNGTAAVTDNSGAYHLGSTAVTTVSGIRERSVTISLTGKRLGIFCPAPERVSVDLFSLDGRRIAIVQSSVLTAGYHAAFGASSSHAYCATLRTGVLTAGGLALAWTGGRRKNWELAHLAYPMMALGAYRLLAEDLRQERKGALFLSLLVYGAALTALPRVGRRTA